MKIVCIIPARGGSVRIPGKNKKLFHGRPIIERVIETARKTRLFDEIIVSTDDVEIANIAKRQGTWVFARDPDDGIRGTQEVAAEVLEHYPNHGFAIACVLYPTAVLLTWTDLVEGWLELQRHDGLFAYSVDPLSEDIGGYYWGFAQAFVERLDLDAHGVLVQVDRNRCCDINTAEDWARAETLYDRNTRRSRDAAAG